MFCPSCGARNPTGARTCLDCKRALPAAPGARASRIEEVALTVPDGPAAPPSEPPRILKRPPPLAPPPNLDALPRGRSMVGPDDPTLVRPRVPSPVAAAPLAAPSPRAAPPPVTLASGAAVAMPGGSVVPVPSATPAPVTAVVPGSSARSLAPLPPTVAVPTEEFFPAPGASQAFGAPTVPIPPSEIPQRRTAPPSAAPPRPPSPPRSVTPTATATQTWTAPLAPAPTAPPSAPPAHAPSTHAPRAASPATSAAGSGDRIMLALPSGVRLWAAAVLDTALGAALVAAALVAFLTMRGVRVAWQPVVDTLHAEPIGAGAPLLLLPWAVVAAYHFATVVVLGGTLGQRAVGLRVCATSSGKKPGVVRVFVRALATAAGVVAFAVGPSWAWFMDARRRGLGDVVARCVVVRAPAKARV